jgi:hypothetical protein
MTQSRALGWAALLGGIWGLWACSDDASSTNTDLVASASPAKFGTPGASATADPDAVSGAAEGASFGDDTASGSARAAPPAAATAAPPAGMTLPAPVSETCSDNPLLAGCSGTRPAGGTLTAGAWDDNRNITRFLDYRARLHDEQLPGLLDFAPTEHTAAQVRTQPVAHSTLDVSLVVDTTGSMGDELSYLQAEFLAISSSIEANYPGAAQRWSLVVYRDRGDSYTTRPFDFETDPVVFRQHLADQSAGGGGDIPEAPDAALDAMNQLSWRTDGATARLAFWVADAPHHAEQAGAMKAAIVAAQAAGVHIYPVASSGVDEFTELSMRSTAQLTGGRYLFLTNDSGVGNSHKEPSIPCYFVTKLDSAILRMVDIEMSGVYREPTSAELIRAGGDPQSGACKLDSGETVYVF